MVLLMMLLTATTAWAEEVMVPYAVTSTTKKTTLTHNGGNYESVTWDYISGTNSTPWNGGATYGVDDEYDITFKPNKYLTLVGSDIKTSAETKFTVTVGDNAYYIKSASIGGVTANAGLNAKSLDVTVPSGSTINVLYVTLIRYYTVTPASGLTVTSGTSATSGGTTYYKPGTIVTVEPTNTHHIVEGTGGTGSASVSVASDKRSFSFTMPDQDVSPTATLTEVYRVSPASGITLSPAAYFTYGDAQYYKPNTTITLSSTVPTGQHVIYKAGNKTLAGNTYTVNSSDGDVTLTAEYPYNTYTVQFNGNGSTSGSMSNQSFTYATAQNLTDNAFTRTGYTFADWNTQADGSGTSYINQQSVNNLTTTNGGTVTLYAQWTANTYTVTLNKQDGNGGSASATATYDAAMPAITVPTRTGYTFGGYFTQTNGGGTQYYNADGTSTRTWNLTAATTLYAKWAIITYNITYELDGGSADNPTSYNIETPDFTLTNPTKEGYHFVGWTKGNNSTLLPTVTIEQGSTGNLDYTAHYKTNNFTVGDLSYQWTSGTEVKVTACNSDATLITIPATVTNEDVIYSVTAIDASAFSGCTSLLCLILNSETPPTLGSNAFSACTALNAIGVPEGTAAAYKAAAGWLDYEDKIYAINGKCGTNVYYSYNSTTTTLSIFGTGAMEDYTSRNIPWNNYRSDITTVVIGDGVTYIGGGVFYGCTSLKSVEIPASVTSIGDFAFMYCTSLESITIPASVTSIGQNAFHDCTSLESIEIPASVTSIDDFAFVGCTSLASISVAEGNPAYDSRNDCNAIIETATNTLIQGCKKTVIPGGSDGVTTIGQYAFSNCTGLTSVEIPDGVTSIGYEAFANCTGLTSVEIPASVTSIGYDAFEGCTSLESIEIPASVTTIGEFAFVDCTDLSTVTIYAPELSEYGYRAFYNNADGRKIYVFKNCVDTYKAKAEDMGVDEDDILAITDINLKDNDDNRSLIAAASGNALAALDVTLKGRTLCKDGKWNTLCLPFNVVLEGSPLEGATARPLTAASITGTTLNLNFGDAVSTLVAGTPYMIKWESGDDIVNPVFEGVTIDATDRSFTSRTGDTQVSFLGTYKSTTYTDEDKSILFLGADNTLYYPQSGATIGACRAYFKIVEDDAPQPVRKLMSFRLVFGNDETLSGSFAASIQRGDANADGSISVTDIAVVVNCILQLDNTGGFSDYGADANGDGQVTVTDIGVIVDKILGSPSPTPPEGGEPQ